MLTSIGRRINQCALARGIGIGMPFGGPPLTGGPSYSAEAEAYFAAMSVAPDATRKGLLAALIDGLVADAVWSELLWLSIGASHDAQAARINAKTPAQVATVSGIPVFTADQGYKGDNSAAYLDSGIAGTALTDTSNSLFAFVRQRSAAKKSIAGYSTGRHSLVHGGAASNINCYQYTATPSASTSAGADNQFICGSRTGTTQTFQIESAVEDTDTVATTTVGNTQTIRFLADSASYSDAQLAAYGFGLHLDNTKASALRSRIRTYLTAVGAI